MNGPAVPKCPKHSEGDTAQDAEARDQTLLFLAKAEWLTTGEDFFQAMARFLAGHLGMDYVCIDRLVGEGLTAETLAIWVDGQFEDNVEYTLADTPCGDAVGRTVCCFPAGVRHRFPKDRVLQDLEAESYLGITLWGSSGKSIGLIALIGRRPLTDSRVAESTLALVGVRAAGELERRQVEDRLHRLSDQVRGVIYQYRLYPDGRSCFPFSSSGMNTIYEVTPEEVREDATPVFGRLHPEDVESTTAAIYESAHALSVFHWEFRVVLPRQGLRWRMCDAVPERLFDGSTLWHGIIVDITERKHSEEERAELQAQLQQAQKLESLGSLAGGVAHDMNNVLGAILGLASLHMETQPPGSAAWRAFETIAMAATRGGNVVKGLLRFARQSPAEELELDMNAILSEEIRLLERTTLSRIHLVKDFAMDLRPIRGDAGALTHAFMNLCVNAVDAMPETGTLSLRTRNVDREWIEVLVEDTGFGMPKEVLEKALDPFFTTKEVGKGTGLGLSMVYSTVKAHQGQLEILSEPGQGTRVRMRFPAPEIAALVPDPSSGPSTEASHRFLKVLVVDDDELIRETLLAVLEVLGHSATIARSGEEALELVEAGLQPDIVVLDMNMPGMGGADTLPRLRSLCPSLPVLLATGRVDQTVLDLAEAHSGVTLLSKPFSMEELRQHLESPT